MTQKRIIIYLEASLTQASWVIVDELGKITQSVAHGELNTLVIDANTDTWVIAPAFDVLLAAAKLPKLSRQKLNQALPFALEEQLIDDVGELHFATGEYQSDGTLPVAIVSQPKMAEWLDLFKSFNITPCAFVPAPLILSVSENQWQVNTADNLCLVRTGKLTGFACEPENLATMLELHLAEQPEAHTANLNHTSHSMQQLLENFVASIETQPYINLLQGQYQAKQQTSKLKKVWLAAAYLTIALVIAGFLNNLISFFILHNQAVNVETAINKIYQHNFPQAKSIVAPRDRMTAKLKSLSGQANRNNFLALLSEVAKSLAEAKGVRIVRLDFREQQLTLELSATSFDNLDLFVRGLTQQGLVVKQQNAAITGAQVKSTLLIRAGTA